MSADALHRRIAADVQRRIAAGEWRPGDQLPSRTELAAEYDIHPQTVRLAVGLLRRHGIVEGEARRRLVVAYPPAVRTLTNPDAPWPYGCDVIDRGDCRAGEELAGRLAVPVGAVLHREVHECWDPNGRSAMLATMWWRGRRGAHDAVVVEVGSVPLAEVQAHSLGLTVDTVAYRLMRTRLGDGAPVETADLILPMDRWQLRLVL